MALDLQKVTLRKLLETQNHDFFTKLVPQFFTGANTGLYTKIENFYKAHLKLPSVEEMERSTSNSGLIMENYSSIGSDYAKTLNIWRANFWKEIEAIKGLGYPDRFIRMWDYYLALCEAGFNTGNTDDVHIIFQKT